MPEDDRFRKTWTLDGVAYTFQVLSGHQMMQVQTTATRLMGDATDMYARAWAERIALLQTACVAPDEPELGALPFPQLSWLMQEVDQWFASFRGPDTRASGSMGAGGREPVAVPVSPDLSPAAP
jgi:hypothetical protein